MMDPAADDLLSASIGRSLTHPALTMLTTMAYLLTMLRSLLRRKQEHDTPASPVTSPRAARPSPQTSQPTQGGCELTHARCASAPA